MVANSLFITGKPEKEEPGSGSRKLEAAQRNGQEDSGIEIYIYRERYISRVKSTRKRKSC